MTGFLDAAHELKHAGQFDFLNRCVTTAGAKRTHADLTAQWASNALGLPVIREQSRTIRRVLANHFSKAELQETNPAVDAG